jgi:23S rRNA pseudouridine1911/1915/1917 synthase
MRPGIVHRLDKGTSGVLIAGKTLDAVAKLSSLFAQRKVRKVYLSVNVGHPGDATIVEPIGRSTKNRQEMCVYDVMPPGKPATTHVRTLVFDGKVSTALVRIETGRTHQIRVHLRHRRTPIIGDDIYGNVEWNRKYLRSYGVRRPLLHAYETEFEHPFTGAKVVLTAPVPTDLAEVIRRMTTTEKPLLDSASCLTCSTEVKGKAPGERGRGFVPLDRLVMDDENWTDVELPEELPLL